jgi:hypothetical protein
LTIGKLTIGRLVLLQERFPRPVLTAASTSITIVDYPASLRLRCTSSHHHSHPGLKRKAKSEKPRAKSQEPRADFVTPSSPNPLTFQELILRLQTFWAERGCVLQQPYDVEVGAGTMAPETFLRVLGPKPYKVAYVQPSRRPADGRYGENPNRLFKHMQLQVILKPPPENVQEL